LLDTSGESTALAKLFQHLSLRGQVEGPTHVAWIFLVALSLV
jgi:hypothetical protein